jgi:hypothetical protein
MRKCRQIATDKLSAGSSERGFKKIFGLIGCEKIFIVKKIEKKLCSRRQEFY